MTIGIYALVFNNYNEIYIGQSVDVQKRYNSHIHYLKQGKDENVKLHRAYSKYGIPSLEIVEECTIAELDSKELEYIILFDTVNTGLNKILPINGIGRGTTAPASIYSEDVIRSLVPLLLDKTKTLKDIESISGINKNTIISIYNGDMHRWFSEEYHDVIPKIKELAEYRRINSRTAVFSGKVIPSIISPAGEIISNITNIRKLARELGLDPGSLNKVINGKLHMFKGYKLYGC